MIVKFLRADMTGPHSGLAYPLGEWVTVRGTILARQNGIHLIEPREGSRWIEARAFEVETRYEVLRVPHNIVARSARLVRELTWSALDFIHSCLDAAGRGPHNRAHFPMVHSAWLHAQEEADPDVVAMWAREAAMATDRAYLDHWSMSGVLLDEALEG